MKTIEEFEKTITCNTHCDGTCSLNNYIEIDDGTGDTGKAMHFELYGIYNYGKNKKLYKKEFIERYKKILKTGYIKVEETKTVKMRLV